MKTNDWRSGFVAAGIEAETKESWDKIMDWAKSESIKMPVHAFWRRRESTDLAGGKHAYTDTYAAGFKDGAIGILDELNFIASHNSGGEKKLFSIMLGWLRRHNENAGNIIPPGHF